ncbi:MAG: hypothetical protein A3H91_11615 [Gammaproteobacteria bacterium RIFCSPLOWO2_02_FULL_61_13]|nr:MAG: hypothetical protein A3H91_11615 [Gammaproteobacteria bacterium RIFCSPLOWO2_02_FULL_61_13]
MSKTGKIHTRIGGSSAHGISVRGRHALSILEKCVRRELDTGLVTNVSAALAIALAEIGVPAAAMRGIILTVRCAGLEWQCIPALRNL